MSNSATGPSSEKQEVLLSRYPASARVTIRDELQRIRMQLEVLGLDEAEKDVRRAILSASEALEIPHYLSVSQIQDIPEFQG